MWNSVLMDGVKWSFDRSSPPLTDGGGGSHPDFGLEESQFRSWNFESHQQTNYADWTNRLQPGEEGEDAEDLFVHHDPVDGRGSRRNYPSAAELFRNFVGDESADRMEFYINHLTMEGCDANNIASALMAESECTAVEESSANVVYRPPFPLLDTITEETVEELLLELSDSSSLSASANDESSESPSSNSGRWGWGWGWLNTSDDDSSSVIHMPVGGGPSAITSGSLVRHSEMTDVNSGIYRTDGLDVDFDLGNDDDDFDDNDDGEWSERDQEVPKKKRRIGSSIDEEDKESASSRSPSVTDSLIQFEALEKELVDTESEPFAAEEEEEESASAVVFRTSATTLPFEDADDRVPSPETDPEVFLDCHEHLEAGGLVDEARLLQTSSVNFFNFLDSFQETSQTSSQEFYTTCGSDWFSPPSRSWSSMPSLDWNVGDESITEMRSCRSACDVSGDCGVMGMGASGAQLQQTYQGQSAALRPSQPWVITFDPPQEMEEEEEEEEEEEDDQVNDDDHWEPDGFLNSDIEEYDTGSNSDDDDYSTERGDRFDEFGLGFISGRSQRMRSFRSYGDSLNMLDTTDDPILHSNSSSSSSCSPDRSSPEEDHRHPASSRSRHSVEALSEDSGYGDASGSHPLMMQQQQRTNPDNSNNKRAGTSSMEEARMVDPSTPPAKCHHTLELPNSLGLAICLPDGSPPSCSPGDCQWSPEVERATRDEYQDDDDDDVWEEEAEEEEQEEKADELREEDKNEVKDEEMTGQSALLMRRQPRSRPTPLSLKEAEEFLILQDHAAEVVNDGQSRCGVPGICIDLESKMSHTLDGNAATNDDILPDHPGTDLEASKFNPQIGSSGWEEVPDGMGEAVTAGADHTKQAEGKGEEEKEHSLHSTDGGSGFIRPPDASKHNSASHGHNVTYSDSIAMDSAFYPAPVVLKRYGPRQEVEVYISHQQLPVGSEDLDPPVPTSTTVVPSGSSIRGVHFSPVVSAVNWRESYLNQSEDDSDDHSTSNGSAAETNPETKNCSAPPESATKVRVAEVSPSVAQRVKLMPDSPPDVVNVIEADRGTPNSGRNESNSNSCTTTSNSATTTATPTTTTTTTPTSSTTTTGNNSKKPPLFQRFSLSRLSARMSATFSRSDSKRESGKKVVGSDGPIPTDAKDVPTTATETTTTSPPVTKGNSKKSSKNKQQPDACPEVKPTSKKIDDFKVVKEPKKRFFSRTFQRSSSTPPMSSSVTAQPEATIQTRATLTAVSPTAATAAVAGASGNDNNGATSSSNVSCRPIESVARQPSTTSSNDEKNTPPTSPAAIGDSSRPPVVNSTSPTTSQPSVEPESGSCPPIPSPRSKVQASHAKPPLPPQTKPRTIHARKNYLVQPAEPPPPVPMVSSAGLQHALQHFKETARMDRERLANSVPDLVATAPSTPTPRPTSDCIDPRETNEVTMAPAQQPPACHPVTLFPASRERARQAALSRASSVESAWNATASRATLNLSRRNIASSGSSQDVAGITGGTQGHGRTKSRPVVPGLLETNLDSVPSSYSSSNNNYNNPDETNLDELIQNLQLFCNNNKRAVEYSPQPLSVDSASATTTNSDKRFKSMLNLGSSSAPVSVQPDIDMMMTDPTSSSSVRVPDANRAKSMEFLLDEDNKSTVQVPENQLKKCGERKMSEHELRIQRSLQKLNVPEWYKNNARSGIGGSTTSGSAGGSNGSASTATNGSSNVNANNTGVLRRRDYHGGSISLRNGGWSGLSSANRDAGTASSMTSLGSALSRSGTPTRVVIPTRVRADWRNIKSSRESLSSPAETCNSPSWNGGPTSLSSTQQSFSRWGSGRSSYSTCPSPAPSTSSSASAYRTSLLNQHGRAPYLGWRSQEKLNSNPAPLSIYQSPAERLASTLLTKTGDVGRSESRAEAEPTPPQLLPQRQQQDEQQETDEVVRSSIRQVTSAIVHYVSESSDGDQPPSPASRNGLSRSPERHPLEALSRSPSPRRQRCVWLESSFVGGGTSPTSHHANATSPSGSSPGRPESPPSTGSSHHLHHHRSTTSTATNGRPAGLSDRTGPLSVVDRDHATSPQPPPLLLAKRISPPPVSATLDDVLNSLLGLAPPSPMHGLLRRPVSQPTIHNKQAHHQQQQDGQQTTSQSQQPYQHQHQQMRGNNNNSHEGGASRSFNDLRSSSHHLQ